MSLRIAKITTKQVEPDVKRVIPQDPIGEDSALAYQRCSACKKPLGGGRWGIAEILDNGNSRYLRLCSKCVKRAENSVRSQDSNSQESS
jgi:hypothetical protein